MRQSLLTTIVRRVCRQNTVTVNSRSASRLVSAPENRLKESSSISEHISTFLFPRPVFHRHCKTLPHTTLWLNKRDPIWFFQPYQAYSQAAEIETESLDVEEASREEQKGEEVVRAVPRLGAGKIVSKKERKAGRVPSIVFEQENGHLGGNKQLISVETKQMERLLKKIGKSHFLARTFDLEVYSDEGELQSKERVLATRGTDRILNVTFIRAPPHARLNVHIPLIFLGEDACPGIRKGGYLNTIMRTVKYQCPGNAIPPFIEVDLSILNVGEKVLLKDLNVGPDVRLCQSDGTLPVCKIMGSRYVDGEAAASKQAK